MLQLMAIPGILLTIIAVLIGYIYGQAVNIGLEERLIPIIGDKMLPTIVDAAKQAGAASGRANTAATEASAILEKAKSGSKEIDSTQEQVKQILNKNNQTIKDNFETFSQQLVTDPGFRDALGKAYRSDVASLKSELGRLQIFDSGQPEQDPMGHQIWRSRCPTGTKPISGTCVIHSGSGIPLQNFGPNLDPLYNAWECAWRADVDDAYVSAVCVGIGKY
jgi:hypothetical protein